MCAEQDASYIVMHHASCKCRVGGVAGCEHVHARRRKPGKDGVREQMEVREKVKRVK